MKEMTSRQVGMLGFVLFLSCKMLALPSFLYRESKASSFYSILFLFLIEIVLLIVIVRFCRKNPGVTLFDLIKKRLGKVFSKLILLLFAVYFAFNFIFIFNETFSFLKELVYEEYKLMLFLVIFALISFMCCIKGIKALAKTCEFVFFIMVFSLIGTILIAFVSGNLSVFNPAVENWGNLLLTTFKANFFFSEVLAFAFFAGHIRFEVDKKPFNIFLYSGLSILITISGMCMYFCTYPVTAVLHRNAISDICQFLPKIAEIGRLDILAIFCVIILVLLQSAIFLWCLFQCVDEVFKFKRTKILNVITLLAICFLIFFYIFNMQRAFEFSYKLASYVSVILIVLTFSIFIKRSYNEKKVFSKDFS